MENMKERKKHVTIWGKHVWGLINSSEPLRKWSDAHNKHLINICNYYGIKILALQGAFKMVEE